MIRNPIILWIILASQILFMAQFIYSLTTLMRVDVFIPMLLVNFVFGVVLIWVTYSHIKLLAESKKTNTDPFE